MIHSGCLASQVGFDGCQDIHIHAQRGNGAHGNGRCNPAGILGRSQAIDEHNVTKKKITRDISIENYVFLVQTPFRHYHRLCSLPPRRSRSRCLNGLPPRPHYSPSTFSRTPIPHHRSARTLPYVFIFFLLTPPLLAYISRKTFNVQQLQQEAASLRSQLASLESKLKMAGYKEHRRLWLPNKAQVVFLALLFIVLGFVWAHYINPQTAKTYLLVK